MEDTQPFALSPVSSLPQVFCQSMADRLSKALANVGSLELDGKNKFHNYQYPTVAQVRGNAGRALSTAGIGIIPEIVQEGRATRQTDKGKETNVTFVKLVLHVFTPDGLFSVRWFGESEDLTDKGAAKAVSAALKSFLMAMLMMPVCEDENDDGANDALLVEQRERQANKKQTTLEGCQRRWAQLGQWAQALGLSVEPLPDDKASDVHEYLTRGKALKHALIVTARSVLSPEINWPDDDNTILKAVKAVEAQQKAKDDQPTAEEIKIFGPRPEPTQPPATDQPNGNGKAQAPTQPNGNGNGKWTLDEANAITTPKGTRLGTCTPEQLEYLIEHANGELKSAAQFLREYLRQHEVQIETQY